MVDIAVFGVSFYETVGWSSFIAALGREYTQIVLFGLSSSRLHIFIIGILSVNKTDQAGI